MTLRTALESYSLGEALETKKIEKEKHKKMKVCPKCVSEFIMTL